MSADLSIHILDKGATEEHYKDFKRKTMGSKYFGGLGCVPLPDEREDECLELFSNNSQIWVGSVSWLGEEVPDVVRSIYNIIGEDFPLIDEGLIGKVEAAYDKCVNKTTLDVEKKEKIVDFLKEHMGEKACTISW